MAWLRFNPRLRFSLRTMLVVTTLVATGLAWQMNHVRQRQAVMQAVEAHGGRFETRSATVTAARREAVIAKLVADMTHREHDTHGVCRVFAAMAPFELPTWRRLFGDRLYWDVVIYDRADLAPVRQWFPEAAVLLVQPPN
jgi:hypothetical protein